MQCILLTAEIKTARQRANVLQAIKNMVFMMSWRGDVSQSEKTQQS